ncbi:beta-glucosidase [Flavobacteriaceae bacterium TP-CH-4]|uniref:Beta-glucosidase n=1 Tax=Pelagihabitans pacificus TaxID=2696054 RepID=A0A967AWC8_9FLAO|nr:glucoamylase family protein [Pelagihabitans pacificus]NHF61119.1 beta-glucosidase [Pelagihabitans pacificus]
MGMHWNNGYRLFFLSTLFAISLLIIACEDKGTKDSTKLEEPPSQAIYLLTDQDLLNMVQQQTIAYFWEGAEPNSGMAPERIHLDNVYPSNDRHIVTTGGTGFGLMAILVGVERGFIPRDAAIGRMEKIVDFLETCDRYHGVWPHWLDGRSGKTKPFSEKDDGGDLVETAFLIQGLLTVKGFLNTTDDREQPLAERIQELWESVEWDWYTNKELVLYWHWSPNFGWEMNFPVRGYNEALIMYVLAAASPTHPISREVYSEGWARGNAITTDTEFYGLKTILDHYETLDDPVGPLFWAHYSFLGLNPTQLKDAFADYWSVNRNHALIHYRYCVDNPKNYKGYGEDCWGLTSSYSRELGYAAHRPTEDLGVISPTAALSSMPYTPEESLRFLRHLYRDHSDQIGTYGPFDAFSEQYGWSVPRYLAIDQGPIPVMIENYRTSMLWNLFMANTDVQGGLLKLGFSF